MNQTQMDNRYGYTSNTEYNDNYIKGQKVFTDAQVPNGELDKLYQLINNEWVVVGEVDCYA